MRLVGEVTTRGEKSEECIHRFRTETRRADAALRFFADCLPRRRTERIRRQLSDIRGKAGLVRDFDILLPLLSEFGDQLPEQTVAWLLERVGRLRAEKMRSLKRFCQQLLKRDFKGQTQALCHRIGWRPAENAPSLPEYSSQSIDRLVTRFCNVVESIGDDEQQLHDARILGRRLRYTLELVKDNLPQGVVDDVCRDLSTLQDELGASNDQVSVWQFLQTCEQECDQKSMAVSLRPIIDALKVSMTEQANSAMQLVNDKAKSVRSRVAELTLACETH